MSSEFAVVCEHLDVVYGGVKAVNDVSFRVETGEVFGLLGPNGAGKTSVVRALSTIIDPAAGRVVVAGNPLSDAPGIRRSIGVLPESNGYPGAVMAFEYLVYFGRLYGLTATDARNRATALLTDLGLRQAANNKIGAFSRGMRQRLGIARALINHPDVLFLDEPTLGLDPAGREDVLARLSDLASHDGTSVVLCSHLLDDVERVCDRIAILDKGSIVASGTVPEVAGAADKGRHVVITAEPAGVDRAIALISGLPRVATAVSSGDGRMDIELVDPVRDVNFLLSALINSEIAVLGVERRTPRLSEAFLALTTSERTKSP